MSLGPIEIIVIGFPESNFNGRIVPEVQKLIDRGIVNVVDGVLIQKDADDNVSITEFEQDEIEPALAEFKALLGDVVYDLVSAEDVEHFAVAMPAGSSAAVLAFEHAWAKPFRDAVRESGGETITNLRIPPHVVEEVLASLTPAE